MPPFEHARTNNLSLSIASVILDQALDRSLDYLIPSELSEKLQCGMRVTVPVKNTLVLATVFEIKTSSPAKKLKTIHALVSDSNYLTADLFALARWISYYYCSPLHKVLKAMLPPSIRKNSKAKEQLFIQSLLTPSALLAYCEKIRRKQAKQAEVLDILLKHSKGILLSELIEKARVTKAPTCLSDQTQNSPLQQSPDSTL